MKHKKTLSLEEEVDVLDREMNDMEKEGAGLKKKVRGVIDRKKIQLVIKKISNT